MSDTPAPGPNLLGGLVRELAAALPALPDDLSAAPTFPFVDADTGHLAPSARPPAILDGLAAASTGPQLSVGALAQAEQILVAAGIVSSRQWTLTGGGTVVQLGEGEYATIGRVPGADVMVVVPDPTVSKQHCRVVVIDGDAVVQDLGSTNGTVVRRAGKQKQVSGPVRLRSGDVLGVADDIVLARVTLTAE